jgi:hypothetical protein
LTAAGAGRPWPRFFIDAFDGVLVHDFWAAYDAIEAADHQCCLAHLPRELEKVDLTNGSALWKAFAKKLRRLVRDGIRLRKRADFDPARYGAGDASGHSGAGERGDLRPGRQQHARG